MVFEQNGTLPKWLVTSRTVLLPKSNETAQAKNYRPIAGQNIRYKLFIKNCATNNIITPEQAGGKQGSWGCTDQLLINKLKLDKAKQHHRNLLMMWFNYKKLSIPFHMAGS